MAALEYRFNNGEILTEEEAKEFLADDVRCCVTCKFGYLKRDDKTCLECLSGTDNYKEDKYKIFNDGIEQKEEIELDKENRQDS